MAILSKSLQSPTIGEHFLWEYIIFLRTLVLDKQTVGRGAAIMTNLKINEVPIKGYKRQTIS